jgi:hypothetical protein
VSRWGQFTDIKDIKKEMFQRLEFNFENSAQLMNRRAYQRAQKRNEFYWLWRRSNNQI